MHFSSEYTVRKELVAGYLEQLIIDLEGTPEPLLSSMKYSILNGGKRIRPILFLEVFNVFEKTLDLSAIKILCAIECIHTYSLIHDDLPCMDNDDYRRGQLTNHKIFGDDIAVLAGDALLNLAYELMFKAIMECTIEERSAYISACAFISSLMGSKGLIAGQTMDIKLGCAKPTASLLASVYQHKTGDLLYSALGSAAIICGANETEQNILKEYAYNFAFAFQIQDDLADCENGESPENTFTGIFGIKNSKQTLNDSINKAVEHLSFLDKDVSFLKKLVLKSLNHQKLKEDKCKNI